MSMTDRLKEMGFTEVSLDKLEECKGQRDDFKERVILQSMKPTLNFEVYEDERPKLEAWIDMQHEKMVEQQKKDVESTPDLEDHELGLYARAWVYGKPYYGPTDGWFQYVFTPTTIGCSLVVHNTVTGDKIELTDYGMW